MLFSGIPFLFYFLPVVVLLYFLSPKGLKNPTLFVCSLVFYAWGEPRLVVLMLLTVFCGYVLALLTEKFGRYKTLFLSLDLMICLGFLGYFKYADFLLTNFNAVTGLSLPLLKVTLPIGISFYTFQLISYHIDVFRGKAKAQRNFLSLATYIAMFPQLIAGPIVRYADVSRQLENREHSVEKAALGVRRFVLGLGKKVLLANTLGEVCEIFRGSGDKSVVFFWFYAFCACLQIYFDFSGYSDMAIGLGKIFGFDFLENFNYPYIAKSITDFWRRWHISLGSWFRDYVYIPLGGSRVGKGRLVFNILTVWMLTGFWHGASWTFILWGLYFALLLILEKVFLLKKLEKSAVLSRVYVLLLVAISFVLFSAGSVKEAAEYTGAMFGAGSYPLVNAETLFYLKNYGFVFLIGVLGATPLPKKICEKWGFVRWLEPFFLPSLLAIATAYLVDGSFNPFLYFRF